MTLFGLALAVLLAGGCGALVTVAHPRWATRLGTGGAVLASTLGLIPAIQVLFGRDLAPIDLPWNVPGGAFSLGIDPLSAFFLVPIFVVGAATAVYGAAYLRLEATHKQLGAAWLWFDLLLASMALVATARNGLLFTSEGRLVIRNATYARDERPVDGACGCYTCRTHSRAYLRHLYATGEVLALRLNTLHNLHHYLELMRRARQAISEGGFLAFAREVEAREGGDAAPP